MATIYKVMGRQAREGKGGREGGREAAAGWWVGGWVGRRDGVGKRLQGSFCC